ncbi:MAG: 7,8-dihydropterin-6-yl-methyl-4-(beta-D-ribofuranosyl)aminobenzene 5-phosphate synthase [Pseudothermotoga sp.]|nr:7,8-dihydropterin-6-yl-methyl-4-(beta-D-ribofuranosyl)aminobenzene 5-phosphate synthase [Pseudothermotoga sp.]
MNLKVLCNDKAREGFYSEHGLSILIDDKILFDTGQTDVFLKNGRIMNIDFEKIEKIIISHGHYDHAGGLKYWDNVDATVYIHKEAVVQKYSQNKPAGIPFELEKTGVEIRYLQDDITIDKIQFINSVPLFENIIDKNFTKNGEYDLFEDEINIVIEDKLFTGCAHRGIENIIEYVLENRKVNYVIGGFHLVNSPLGRIEKIAKLFFENDLCIIPLHCTGQDAVEIFKKKLKEKCVVLQTGDELRLP